VLDANLVELLVVEGAECRRQAAQRPNEAELSGDGVNDEPEPHLLRERQALLGFAFGLGKRIARREKVRVQLVAAVGGVGEVAHLVCRLERAAHQVAAGPDMPGPGHDAVAEFHVGPGLETPQSASVDQVVTELAEAIYGGPVVAEARAGDHGQPYIGAA